MAAADPRARDRTATAGVIIAAAKAVLAEDGFQSFGVNAIARRAGCDKQLIYRYFGGLDGLAEAIGADLARDLTEELKAVTNDAPPKTYAELMQRLALGLLELLRGNRLMQQINAWEAAAPSPLVQKMSVARARRMMQWTLEMRGDLAPPTGVDAQAMNAIIIAAVQQLVVSGAANGAFSGLPLRTDADWDRLRAALAALVQCAYSEAARA
jgi:AcrR family transcriptional regulator